MNVEQAIIHSLSQGSRKISIHDCDSPPRNLEQEYNITGISQTYKGPDNQPLDHKYEINFFNKYMPYYSALANNFERFSKDYRAQQTLKKHLSNSNIHQELNTEFKALAKTNPEIKELFDEKDFIKTYNIIHGMCSGFNIDDINFYINASKEEKAESAIKKEIIKKSTSIKMNWIPAPNTLIEIVEKTGTKEKLEAYQTAQRVSRLPTSNLSIEEEIALKYGYGRA